MLTTTSTRRGCVPSIATTIFIASLMTTKMHCAPKHPSCDLRKIFYTRNEYDEQTRHLDTRQPVERPDSTETAPKPNVDVTSRFGGDGEEQPFFHPAPPRFGPRLPAVPSRFGAAEVESGCYPPFPYLPPPPPPSMWPPFYYPPFLPFCYPPPPPYYSPLGISQGVAYAAPAQPSIHQYVQLPRDTPASKHNILQVINVNSEKEDGRKNSSTRGLSEQELLEQYRKIFGTPDVSGIFFYDKDKNGTAPSLDEILQGPVTELTANDLESVDKLLDDRNGGDKVLFVHTNCTTASSSSTTTESSTQHARCTRQVTEEYCQLPGDLLAEVPPPTNCTEVPQDSCLKLSDRLEYVRINLTEIGYNLTTSTNGTANESCSKPCYFDVDDLQAIRSCQSPCCASNNPWYYNQWYQSWPVPPNNGNYWERYRAPQFGVMPGGPISVYPGVPAGGNPWGTPVSGSYWDRYEGGGVKCQELQSSISSS